MTITRRPRTASDAATLRAAAHKAGREMSARSVMFYTLVAELSGLGVSDLRAWDLLVRYGPMSAKAFADQIGLTPGAVTGLVNRLEQAGAVRRVPDAADRRKISIVPVAELRKGKTAAYFDSFQRSLETMHRQFTNDELRVIRRFSEEVAELLREETVRLRKRYATRLRKRGR